MDRKVNIGVIGRQLSSKRWEPLFDILKEGAEEDFWGYTTYSLDNNNKYNGSEDDLLIFLATTPKDTYGKDYINFPISSSENEIVGKMQQFIDKVLSTQIPSVIKLEDSLDNEENKVKPKVLTGIVIEINDQDVLLSKDDADSLVRMLEIIDKYGYTIKDVIVE